MCVLPTVRTKGHNTRSREIAEKSGVQRLIWFHSQTNEFNLLKRNIFRSHTTWPQNKKKQFDLLCWMPPINSVYFAAASTIFKLITVWLVNSSFIWLIRIPAKTSSRMLALVSVWAACKRQFDLSFLYRN